MVHMPSWFRDGEVFVSFAPTIGINKDGEDLYVIDADTGKRTEVVDDQIQEDVDQLLSGQMTDTSIWIPKTGHEDRFIGVPVYSDDRPIKAFDEFMQEPEMTDFVARKLGDLITERLVDARYGHGSPSADTRTGTIPYIKFSDLRAGQVNINPTNRVPEVVARKFWKGESSGLYAYDLLTPIRTSKNIGDFCVLMPGQEKLVLTKEILVLHAAESAQFDNFYLLWAMSLKVVRRQWNRIVFMQTNREDVGDRFKEILVPVPLKDGVAAQVSASFRTYYEGMNKLRADYLDYLERDGRHHIFMSAKEAVEELGEEEASNT